MKLKIKNNQLSTIEINNMRCKFSTWLWNENANKNNSDFKEEGNSNIDRLDNKQKNVGQNKQSFS